MLLGALKAPMQKLASLLNEPPAKLARALAAYRDQKAGSAANA
jgi:ribosomal protein L10